MDATEQDKHFQSLFREGEKLATTQKIVGSLSFDEIAKSIVNAVNCTSFYFEDEEYLAVKDILRVYQGFLDNGGKVDFTERR